MSFGGWRAGDWVLGLGLFMLLFVLLFVFCVFVFVLRFCLLFCFVFVFVFVFFILFWFLFLKGHRSVFPHSKIRVIKGRGGAPRPSPVYAKELRVTEFRRVLRLVEIRRVSLEA